MLMDLRNYVYEGTVLLIAARLYQAERRTSEPPAAVSRPCSTQRPKDGADRQSSRS